MELKWARLEFVVTTQHSYNQPIVELKSSSMFFTYLTHPPYNQPIVELKLFTLGEICKSSGFLQSAHSGIEMENRLKRKNKVDNLTISP